MLSAVLLTDTTVLGLIGFGEQALKVKHSWNQDALNATTVTGNEGGEFSDSDVTLSVVSAAKIRKGTLLKDQAKGKSEVLQVTAISTNDLTVTRGFGSSDAETHAAAAVYLIVGQPVQQGDETITDISPARTTAFNFVQNFKRTVKIADEAEAEARNTMHPGVTSEFERQLLHRTLEMMNELNISVIHSVISAAASDTVYGTMKGLREAVNASGGNTNTTAEELSEPVMNAMYTQCWDDGGNPDIVIGNRQQITKFSKFNAGKIRIAPDDKRAGSFVEKYLTDMGRELSLHTDRYMPIDEIGLLDIKGQAQGGGGGFSLAAFKGRELAVEPLAKIGSAKRAQVIAGWTLVYRNALKASAWHTNLDV